MKKYVGLSICILLFPTNLSAQEFCAVSEFGTKGACFVTLSSCRSWVGTSGGTCVYSEKSDSKPAAKAPSYVGPSKWCRHSPEVGFLKNTAMCVYETKRECSEKILSRGEVCLLNPKYDSDPTEEAEDRSTERSIDRSKWVFYFSGDKVDSYLNRESIFRYGQRVDVQVAVNAKINSPIKSTAIDLTIECEAKQHTVRRAIGYSQEYGEGSVVKDFTDTFGSQPKSLDPKSSIAEVYARVCAATP